MSTLIAFPTLGFLVILQSAVVSRVPLLHGTSDLVLLTIAAWALQDRVRTAWQWSLIGGLFAGFISALPVSVPLVSYLAVTGLALMLRRRVWQAPILAMFALTIFGTLLSHAISALAVSLSGASLPIVEAMNLITLPSLILNLVLSVPIFALIGDLANWLHPEEIKM